MTCTVETRKSLPGNRRTVFNIRTWNGFNAPYKTLIFYAPGCCRNRRRWWEKERGERKVNRFNNAEKTFFLLSSHLSPLSYHPHSSDGIWETHFYLFFFFFLRWFSQFMKTREMLRESTTVRVCSQCKVWDIFFLFFSRLEEESEIWSS